MTRKSSARDPVRCQWYFLRAEGIDGWPLCLQTEPPRARPMSNYAWVCFLCRSAVRRAGDATDVRCPSCGKSCECIGFRTPVPPKSKAKEWEALRAFYYRRRQENLERQTKDRVRRIHGLEKEILRLESMPPNDGRTKAVELLKKRLSND